MWSASSRRSRTKKAAVKNIEDEIKVRCIITREHTLNPPYRFTSQQSHTTGLRRQDRRNTIARVLNGETERDSTRRDERFEKAS